MNMWLFYFSSAEAAAAAQLTGVISYRRRKQADISHDLTTPFFCVNTQTHTHTHRVTPIQLQPASWTASWSNGKLLNTQLHHYLQLSDVTPPVSVCFSWRWVCTQSMIWLLMQELRMDTLKRSMFFTTTTTTTTQFLLIRYYILKINIV